MSTILITGGSGFIGRHLCRRLCAEGWKVIVLTRNAQAAKTRLVDSLTLIENLDELPQDLIIDAVINLAGEPLGEGRWTAARKALFYTSRIGTTEQLHQFFVGRAQPPKVLITGSAVGFYGAGSGDTVIDETAGSDDNFSYQLCSQWEQSATKFESMGSRVVYLRTGIVLGQEGALAKMLPAFKCALGGSMGNGRQWMSWIHIDDMVALILYCLGNNGITGAVNATAPNPVQNTEFASTLATTLRRPAFIPMPSFVVKLLFGQMGDELLLQGKKVIPRKVQDSGFNFQYPLLKAALLDVLTTK